MRDRVEAGTSLYFSGKVEKLLMSGDNQSVYYNEPQAMREYAISLGVPGEAIVMDSAGSRTYDTCYRAKAIFGVESALLVTQSFHLPRALFLCNALGVKAAGVEANNLNYRNRSLFFGMSVSSSPPSLLLWTFTLKNRPRFWGRHNRFSWIDPYNLSTRGWFAPPNRPKWALSVSES
ncbi:MAG: YdcF family protein [Ignavibacteriales bacterium]|nr:YdcF family protein [Ignavibacteriales bacterium]